MEKQSLSDKETHDHNFLNALAEAFRVQEAILNATDLPIFSLTPDGIINSFNRSCEVLLGYRSEELIGRESPLIFIDNEELVHRSAQAAYFIGETPDPIIDTLTFKARLQRIPSQEEWALVKKDKTKIPVLLSISALWDEHDNLMGYVGVPKDLSDKKKMHELAKASEEKFRLLAENIPGAIYLCHNDENYTVIYVNDHIETITGYSPKEFLSGEVHIGQLIHIDDQKSVKDEIRKASEEHRRFHIRYRITNRSGELRWIDEVGIGVYTNGELTMLEGFFTDVTTQKEAEEKLKETARENLKVFNNPVTLNAVIGFDRYFKRISPAWSMLLGWSDDELLGRPATDFIHPDDLDSTVEAGDYISNGSSLFTLENRYRTKDGTYRWLLWGSAIDHEHKLFYATAVDITERKRSEEELLKSKQNIESIALKLQEQNRQLDEFAHIISHNLRSPIGNIQALINLLDDNSPIQDYKVIFEKLKNLSKNLGQTMNDLIDTLKVKTQSDLQRVDIRLKELLDKIIQSLEGELIHSEASVTFDFNKAPVIRYPKAYIESIFQNLLSNAIKYRSNDRRPKIHFESDVIKDSTILRVSDNGQGIDLNQYGDKLFGLHHTFHEHEEARGVGLFLIKTQIESMGGSIRVESEVDKGTTFIIRF